MRFYLVLITFLALAACSTQPVYRTGNDPLLVARIEPERYAGLWHEAARLPNSFEEGCLSATASYSLRNDGGVNVVNTCRDGRGGERIARGRARIVGENGEGKLKVSFFWPIEADYWVLDRADDYGWAIVGEPGGRYLWVLTRAEHITPAERAFFETRITALRYRPADLVWSAASSGVSS